MKKTRERAARREAPADKAVGDPLVQKPLPLETADGGSVVRRQEQAPADAVSGGAGEKAGKKTAKARKKEIKLLKKMFK
jgi:hypothetical protein